MFMFLKIKTVVTMTWFAGVALFVLSFLRTSFALSSVHIRIIAFTISMILLLFGAILIFCILRNVFGDRQMIFEKLVIFLFVFTMIFPLVLSFFVLERNLELLLQHLSISTMGLSYLVANVLFLLKKRQP